jgi:preprotein translocase subunit SecA
MSFLKRVLGDPNERELKRIQPIVDEINGLEDEMEALSDDDMRARTAEFRAQFDECEDDEERDAVLEGILPEAFALVREASKRTLGMRHYDVQLIGGMVLHQGKIAEMRTGEGKTLVATLPSYLNALTGRGVHIVTVNDYLAKRDAEWMGRIHRHLGLSVGCILSGPDHQNPAEKSEAYGADITYGTNNEFGFDYLRDNMAPTLENCVQRQLHYAIVDEVDNILIDEARTPLIISAPSVESAEMYVKFARVVPILKAEEDYTVDEKTRTVAISESGIDKIEAAMGIQDIYANMELTRYLENALKAHATMRRDRDYIVRDGEVIIVDEHTGRLMVGRRFNEGLHQAIEAKEHVKVQAENRTVATITFQNYFRLYKKLAGMTGTALTEAQEFDKIYKLDVIVIPTNRPMVRRDENDLIYKTEEAKYNAVVEEIRERHEIGQPLLVGTTSVENSERLSTKLDHIGIPYEILNAKNHTREASIIAQAGRLGAVTISTNMAGRGTDILLGGNPEGMVDQILSRQDIDPEFATEEDLADALAAAKKVCDAEHEKVIELGGLHVIGTERHDSRRIDNQLRGRSGRQGDPGSSRFYVSLEDELMRRFGSDRISKLMDFMKMDEDIPIESGMASRMLEQAQQKVETYYFDIRKHVVEYDDVIAKQREIIYADRRAILEGEDLHQRILDMLQEEVEEVVGTYTHDKLPENWDLQAVVDFFEHWHIPLPEDYFPDNINLLKRPAFLQECVDWTHEQYENKKERIREQLQAIGAPEEQADGLMQFLERNRMLSVVDALWMEHIDSLDVLRSGIGLRGIAQTDPLVEFKREAFKEFEHLKQQIRHYVAESVMMTELNIGVQAPPPPTTPPPQQLQTNANAIAEASGQTKYESESSLLNGKGKEGITSKPPTPKKPMTQKKAQRHASATPSRPLTQKNPAATSSSSTPPSAASQRSSTPKPKVTSAELPQVAPNDPCPCGSKQKYKFCHGLGKVK